MEYLWSPMANTNDTSRGLRHLATPSRHTLTKPLSVLAFWSAIALPALYLPLLVAGLDTPNDLGIFLGLFALHVIALVLGQSHRQT